MANRGEAGRTGAREAPRVFSTNAEFWRGVAVAILAFVVAGMFTAMQLLSAQVVIAISFVGICALLFAIGSAVQVIRSDYAAYGAIAGFIIIYPLFLYLTKVEFADVRISKVGEADVVVGSADGQFFGALEKDRDSYRFIAFDYQMNSSKFEVIFAKKGTDRVRIQCIDIKKLKSIVGTRVQDAWEYDSSAREIVKYDNRGSREVIGKETCRANAPAIASSSGLELIGSAFAQSAPQRPLPAIVADLQSDVTEVRRSARVELSNLGESGIAPLLAELRNNSDNYRLQIGIVIAFSSMLDQTPSLSDAFARAMTPDDIRLFLKMAASEDRALRVPAVEFLAAQFNPAIVAEVTSALKNAPDPKVAYNLLYILSENIESVRADQKQKAIEAATPFKSRGNQTDKFIRKIEQ
ncbi:hypothetical protein [Bradyrhizobium aeschynomenes]|uniref:hypothetical protein n=1 Tax=Bradyrhizobium aeschynomenes TaxID=2734909 RepID=UPI001553B4C2|nr:hypothetical protein [Bradyrhizobium aeschynomenes]NPV19534.1 hypothetical protein [Bradyrhizobium aeschynomenes]